MRRVIYPLIWEGVTIKRPFAGIYSNDDLESSEGNVISDYEGSADEIDLPSYDNSIPDVLISITDISGAALVSKESDNSLAYIKQLSDLTIDISISLPDGEFVSIPLKRIDTGRIIYKFGIVNSGSIQIDLQLPTGGKWICDEQLLFQEGREGVNFLFKGLALICEV